MRDSETNLDFANARYYSSQFGRFMSPDPLGGDVSDPQSLNRYAYVTNSPLSAIDPSGMDGCVIDGFADCVLTFDGGGSGSSGDGGRAFDGGGSAGEGTIDLCGIVDCGFGGGSGLPGPPSSAGLAAEQSFFSDPYIRDPFAFLKGMGEEMTVNSFIGFVTLVDRMSLLSYPTWYRSTHPERYLIRPKNFSEQTGMMMGGVAGFLVPGDEEAGTAQFVRLIGKGEKVDMLLDELISRTFTTEAEHAIISLKDGTRAIVSGGPENTPRSCEILLVGSPS